MPPDGRPQTVFDAVRPLNTNNRTTQAASSIPSVLWTTAAHVNFPIHDQPVLAVNWTPYRRLIGQSNAHQISHVAARIDIAPSF